MDGGHTHGSWQRSFFQLAGMERYGEVVWSHICKMISLEYTNGMQGCGRSTASATAATFTGHDSYLLTWAVWLAYV
jgi:hypothetical protein